MMHQRTRSTVECMLQFLSPLVQSASSWFRYLKWENYPKITTTKYWKYWNKTYSCPFPNFITSWGNKRPLMLTKFSSSSKFQSVKTLELSLDAYNRLQNWNKRLCLAAGFKRVWSAVARINLKSDFIASVNPVARHNSGIKQTSSDCPPRKSRALALEIKSGCLLSRISKW